MTFGRKLPLIALRICSTIAFVRLANAEGKVCRFSDFPVRHIEIGRNVAPKIPPDKVMEKGYREVVADARKSNNFAGHYRLSTDTCGTWLIGIMIADSETGDVHMMGCLSWPYKGLRPDLPSGLSYRLNSRLLIARGCRVSREPCGTYSYEFMNDTLQLKSFVPFKDRYRDMGIIPADK